MRSLSTTGSAKPARCNNAPKSRMSAKGAMRGEIPPSRSLSAAANASRNSASVSPPARAARNNPSGLRARRICTSAPGRSLTNCSASADTTRSSAPSANGRISSSTATRANVASRRSAAGSAAMIVATLALAAMARRTASVGVPRSTARANVRNTADSRSARSAATRSSRNVSAPSVCARRLRARNSRRSKMVGFVGIWYSRSMDEAATPGKEQAAPRFAQFRGGLRSTFRLALDLALPPLCPSCREPLGNAAGLCAPCWSKLSLIEPPYCARLGIPFVYDPGPGLLSMEAIANPPAYDRARAAVRYDDVARALVHKLKYSDRLDLAPLMGRWMARAGRELLSDADALVPVPLHWRRQWARRFNQSGVLAGAISGQCGIPVAHGGLKRVRATPQQVGRSRTDRADNVQGAFEVPAENRAEIAGRRLVLIDDVLTSGATVDACARALLRARAAHVDVLVFARVVAPARAPI